jgi:spore maturation protein CgeB
MNDGAPVRIVILGLAITSSWGNGHATTYRALVRHLALRGHRVLFLERDAPWYAQNRDMPHPHGAEVAVYASVDDLKRRFETEVRAADLVVVGSYVPDGTRVGEWVTTEACSTTAFYDIDTPVTLARLQRGDTSYISLTLIRKYDLYLSFTGGPTLQRIEREFGARMARPLYCCVDPDEYAPAPQTASWDLGYLGTYSADRQPALKRLMFEPARSLRDGRFVVAGAQYPDSITWPCNVTRITHVAPRGHAKFYNAQRFTLNITREEMIRAGWSPSVRLFEAAACGTAIISDHWGGLEEFFEPGRDILIAGSASDVAEYLRGLNDADRNAIGARGRQRVLERHTAAHRAAELEAFAIEATRAGARL